LTHEHSNGGREAAWLISIHTARERRPITMFAVIIALIAIVAVAVVIGIAVHVLFSFWFWLLAAVAILAWMKLRPGRSRQ
jgi:CBS domain containing-hemolysin-like protein